MTIDWGIIKDFIFKAGFSVITAVITAIVTVRLSLKRFYSEKWWEKKSISYTTIIESLHNMKKYCDEHMEYEMTHKEIPKEKQEQLWLSYSLARDEVSKAIDIGSFIICDEAVEELKNLVKSLYRARSENTFFEYLDSQLSALTGCLEKVKVIAKNDLKIK